MVTTRRAFIEVLTVALILATMGFSVSATALADVLPTNDPLMKLSSLKAACIDLIKQQLDDPNSLHVVQYGGFATADHSYLASPGRRWIPIKVRSKDAGGARIRTDWACSSHMLNGSPTDLAAFAQ
jgi:hypothetical protein